MTGKASSLDLNTLIKQSFSNRATRDTKGYYFYVSICRNNCNYKYISIPKGEISSMPGLRFFFDAFSQPSRAVMMLLVANKIPYKPVIVNIAKRECVGVTYRFMFFGFSSTVENRTNEEFTKVCPAKIVPAIDDNGFTLFERCVSPYKCNIAPCKKKVELFFLLV